MDSVLLLLFILKIKSQIDVVGVMKVNSKRSSLPLKPDPTFSAFHHSHKSHSVNKSVNFMMQSPLNTRQIKER